MIKKVLNHSLTILFIISLFFLIITFSIGLPIYFRPFYYLQIKTLNMEELTGYSYETIKEAYDQVLNYLTLSTPFGTGELNYTTEGYNHFADCKVLFNLNLIVLIVSFLIVITLIILSKKEIIQLIDYFKFKPYFFTSIITILIPIIIVVLASIDFDRAFEIFHAIFFPGKTNWLFDPSKDEIIKVMPQTFFMNCGILIACSVVFISITLLVISIIKRKKVVINVK